MPDENLHAFYETSSGQLLYLGTVGSPVLHRAPDWNDTLKITSGCTKVQFLIDWIYGGAEDCVDVNNRASGILVAASHWFPQGKYLATVRGGARDVALSGLVYTHGTEVDVDLGNWSDQCQEKTTGVQLDLTPVNGKPIRVRVLHADKPELYQPDKYVYVFPHPDAWYHGLVVKVFFIYKRIVRRFSKS